MERLHQRLKWLRSPRRVSTKRPLRRRNLPLICLADRGPRQVHHTKGQRRLEQSLLRLFRRTKGHCQPRFVRWRRCLNRLAQHHENLQDRRHRQLLSPLTLRLLHQRERRQRSRSLFRTLGFLMQNRPRCHLRCRRLGHLHQPQRSTLFMWLRQLRRAVVQATPTQHKSSKH